MPIDLPKPSGSADDKKKQTIMVVGTLVLIVIAYLTLKRTGSGAASLPSGGGGGGLGATASGGVDATSATGNQSQLDAISGQLAALTGQVAALPGKAATAVTPPATAPAGNGGPPLLHGAPVKLPTLGHLPSIPQVSNTHKTATAHAPTTKRAASSTGSHTYTVVKGDNLSAIGRKYGLTWEQLYAANKHAVGSNPNLIHPGLKLQIPEKPATHHAAPHHDAKPATHKDGVKK